MLLDLGGESGKEGYIPLGASVCVPSFQTAVVDLRWAVITLLRGENEALVGRLKEFEECGAHVAASGHGGELCQGSIGSWVRKEKKELKDVVKGKRNGC
jgi:hypothetical protein